METHYIRVMASIDYAAAKFACGTHTATESRKNQMRIITYLQDTYARNAVIMHLSGRIGLAALMN
jgi:hypothetical protein